MELHLPHSSSSENAMGGASLKGGKVERWWLHGWLLKECIIQESNLLKEEISPHHTEGINKLNMCILQEQSVQPCQTKNYPF